MRRFTVLVIALVLAPGLQSAAVSSIANTLPIFINPIAPETRPELPEVVVVPELRPELIPEVGTVPELRPELIPEVEAVVPELITINPCDACFEYMTSLIGQLTDAAVPEVARPLPETVPEDLRPLPVPEYPEVEINPIPMPVAPESGLRPLPLPLPSEAEAEESLAVQGIPLPAYIIRK